MTPTANRTSRAFLRNTGSILGGIFGAFVLMEALLFLIDPNPASKLVTDPITGLTIHPPASTYFATTACFNNETRVNASGFHANEAAIEKNPGTFRIVVTGNSFVEAEQVPIDEMFTALLEKQLNETVTTTRFEVIPVGFSSNGTYRNLLYLAHYGLRYKPDLVMNLYVRTDATRNHDGLPTAPRFAADARLNLSSVSPSTSTLIRLRHFIAQNFKLPNALYRDYAIARQSVSSWFVSPNTQASSTVTLATNEDWTKESLALGAFEELSHRSGSRFLLLSWLGDNQGDTPNTGEKERLQSIADERAFPYLDLTSAIDPATIGGLIWSCDGHWNARGHQRVSDVLAAYLQNRLDLLTRTTTAASSSTPATYDF